MKKKKSRKKTVISVLVIVLVFLLAQNLFIGWRFSYGPFKALGDMRMAKISGNAANYGMASVEPLEKAPLTGGKVLFLGSSVTLNNGVTGTISSYPNDFAARPIVSTESGALDLNHHPELDIIEYNPK